MLAPVRFGLFRVLLELHVPGPIPCNVSTATCRSFIPFKLVSTVAMKGPPARYCQKICGRFVAESAAKRYFSTTNGTNVASETLVSVRGNLPVFVLLAPYGNPGSTPGRGTLFQNVRRISGFFRSAHEHCGTRFG
jgi:hypothetical protein